MKTIKILLLALVFAVAMPSPQAQAFDPVTIAILAPIAMKVANAAKPYLIRAGLNTGKCLMKMGGDVLQMFYFPYGLGKMACGSFRSGLIYTIRGSFAPCKLIVHSLLLPVYMVGINVNI